jgi:hypothetical protein
MQSFLNLHARLDSPLPRVTVLRPAVLEYLQNTVDLLRKSPERSRHVLANLIEDGRFIPLGLGKAEIRFTLHPFWVEETLTFLGGLNEPLGPRDVNYPRSRSGSSYVPDLLRLSTIWRAILVLPWLAIVALSHVRGRC